MDGDHAALDHLPARHAVAAAARLPQPRVRATRARARDGARPAHGRHVRAARRRRHRPPRTGVRGGDRLRADRREAAQGGEERQSGAGARRRYRRARARQGPDYGRRVRPVAEKGSAAQERHQGRRLPAGFRPRRARRARRAAAGEGGMKPVYIVDGARTPFLKSRNRPGPFSAADLATQAGRTLLVRQPFAPSELDEVILGCAAPSVDEVNIGRVAALRMGCGQKVPGWTVMRNCASGMQAVDSAINNILAGRSRLVLAGGVDALSRAPLLYADKMVLWFSDMAAAKTTGQRLALFARMPMGAVLKPVIGIMKGLTDPMVGLLMGQTAENLAYRFGISRGDMDAFAVRSHQRVAKAQAQGQLAPGGGEVEALYDASGKAFALDDGVRADASLESLAKL